MNRLPAAIIAAAVSLPLLTACPPPKPDDGSDELGPAGEPDDNDEAGPTPKPAPKPETKADKPAPKAK